MISNMDLFFYEMTFSLIISFQRKRTDQEGVRANAGEVVKKRELSYYCWWKCNLVQPPWKTVRRFLKELKALPYDPTIPLLTYPQAKP